MIKNEIMLKRLCTIVAQTFAVPVDKVLADAKQFGFDAVVEKLENAEENSPNFN